jgi:hypothetical protein
MSNDYSTYTPSCIRDLESAGYYETLMCWSCKRVYAEIPQDARCLDPECENGKVIAVPF